MRYVLYRVKAELSAETSRTYLSYLWWILEPCLTIAVFYVVFGMLFDRGGEGFVSFLVLGVTAWFWFQHTVSRAAGSISKDMKLMLQVYVPKYVFPLTSITFGVFKHIFVILVLVGLLMLLESPSVTWLFYGLVLVVQLLLIISVSFVVAAVEPFVPDLKLVIGPLLRLGMFMSGVFYSQSMIPPDYVPYFRYNPMAGLIMEYRKVMLYSQFPDFVYLAKVALISLLILSIGLWLLKKCDRIYPRLTN
jgi:lipopolysaccharide transport system permease protein